MDQMKSLLRLLCLVPLTAQLACPSRPPPLHSEPNGAIRLGAESRTDEFNCQGENCVHWYRVAVPGTGRLRLFIEAFESTEQEMMLGFIPMKKKEYPAPPSFQLILANADGNAIVSAKSDGNSERAVQSKVAKGSYLVSVSSHDPGRRFGYRLTSNFKATHRPRQRPLKPKPRFEVSSATILEAEGWGADVKALLIDLGSTQGMRAGFKGRLIDDGDEIGKFVIEQVYPDGSRAGIEGSLSRPLGPDTQVEIDVPIE